MSTDIVKINTTELTRFPAEYSDEALKALIKEGSTIDAYVDYDEAKIFISKCTKLRTGLEAERKDKKAAILAAGRTLDGEAKRIREVIEGVENPIKDKKTEIDTAQARAEAERVRKIELAIGTIIVSPVAASEMPLEEVRAQLTLFEKFEVDPEFYAEFYHHAVECRDTSISVLSSALAHREAEEKRKAEQEAEAERLAKERAEFEAEKREQEEKDRARRQAEEMARAKEDAKRAAEQKEIDDARAKLEAEKREVERREREQADKERAEAEAEAAAKRAEELAPDRAKLEKLAKDIRAMSLPKMKSNEANKIISACRQRLDDMAEYVESQVGEYF